MTRTAVSKYCFSILPNILFLFFSITLFSQGSFNPDKQLAELSGTKKNIGLSAAYSVAGDTKWEGGAGLGCLDSEKPFTAQTPSRIASISKNFTAVAIMQLVEQNHIGLDLPIANYLNGLPEDKRQITVRQLMAHTAGIPQYLNDREIENTTNFPSLEAAMQAFIDRPLLFEPGSRYFYTTYGYVILGRIIEKVSTMDYGAYMKEWFRKKVWMKCCRFNP